MSTDSILGDAFAALIAVGLSVVAACALTGRSRSTHYRRAKGPARKADPISQADWAKPPLTLSPAEGKHVLAVINSAQYRRLSICQIWARELDEDRYQCSMSSMYWIARAAGQTRERRRLATHSAKVKPELAATGPSQVWSWDIKECLFKQRSIGTSFPSPALEVVHPPAEWNKSHDRAVHLSRAG